MPNQFSQFQVVTLRDKEGSAEYFGLGNGLGNGLITFEPLKITKYFSQQKRNMKTKVGWGEGGRRKEVEV